MSELLLECVCRPLIGAFDMTGKPPVPTAHAVGYLMSPLPRLVGRIVETVKATNDAEPGPFPLSPLQRAPRLPQAFSLG